MIRKTVDRGLILLPDRHGACPREEIATPFIVQKRARRLGQTIVKAALPIPRQRFFNAARRFFAC
jgi:hypothetical protein